MVLESPRPPQQARSRRTLQRILDAARQILEVDGVEALTVQAVVRRARASVGSFYARFSGKEELLDHLESMVWSEVEAGWEAAVAADVGEVGTLEGTVDTLVGAMIDSARAGGAARSRLRARPGGSSHETTFAGRVQSDARRLLLTHRRRLAHPRPELAVGVAVTAVRGAVRAIEEGSAAFPAPPEADLRRELSRLLLAYLGGAGGGEESEPSEGMEYFDVWA